MSNPNCDVCGTEMTKSYSEDVEYICYHCYLCEECGRPYDDCYNERISYRTCSAKGNWMDFGKSFEAFTKALQPRCEARGTHKEADFIKDVQCSLGSNHEGRHIAYLDVPAEYECSELNELGGPGGGKLFNWSIDE